MEKFYKAIILLLVENNSIRRTSCELYEYAIKILFRFIINITVTFIIATCLDMVKECLFFLTSFFFIRKFSGGLHLNKYVSCFFASEVLIVGSLVLLRLLIKNDCNILIFIFLIIISSILLLLLSPVKNNNKKISKSQNYFFKTMILILTTINLIIVIYLINVNKNIGYALGCGQILSAILVVIPYLLDFKNNIIRMK